MATNKNPSFFFILLDKSVMKRHLLIITIGGLGILSPIRCLYNVYMNCCSIIMCLCIVLYKADDN